MTHAIPWDAGLLNTEEEGALGLESFATALESVSSSVTQGPAPTQFAPYFKPINITIEHGVYYATIYVCHVYVIEQYQQQLKIWFGSLKETDHVRLSVASMINNVPYASMISLLGAIVNTKAKIEIVLDSLVMDGLAYFYLIADKITKLYGGALFIPSYVEQRAGDHSAPYEAMHDFYKWIVEDAVRVGILTEEEAATLHSGSHVTLPLDRLSN